MDSKAIEYSPSELISKVEEGFAGIYKPFAKYQKQNHPLWHKCIETISNDDILNKIIFCNDIIKIPPAKVFLFLNLEAINDNNISAYDKKFIGSFWSYLFIHIFSYKQKKNIGIHNPCMKTALYFYERSNSIIIISEKLKNSDYTESNPKDDIPLIRKKKKQEVKNDDNNKNT